MSPLITGTNGQGVAWRLLGLAAVVVAALLAVWVLTQAQADDSPAVGTSEDTSTPTPPIATPEPTATTVPPDPEANENEAAQSGEARCRRGTVAVPSSPRNSQLGAECRALLALKDELRGKATLNWSVSLSMDQWDGVTVERRRVTKLELPNKRLTGNLPTGLGSLTALRELDLSNNRLRGKVPVELGNLAELRVLKLSGNNRLRGCVLPVLTTVATNDLAAAGLSACAHSCETGWAVPRPAATPELVKDCKVLLGLKDELRGGHPLNWSASRGMSDWDGITVSEGRVTKLEITDRIAMTGTLPVKLGKLKGLRELDLHNSRLQGTVPAELGKLTELIYLDLSKNRLTGQLPPELGNLRKLRTLRLRVNEFTGCVPHELRYVGHLLELPWCPSISKLEKGVVSPNVIGGKSIQLDVDVYDTKGVKLTELPAGAVVAWYVADANTSARQGQANAAVKAERANAATTPAAPLASVAGKPASITYTPPLSAVGTTVTIVAVVDEESCPGRISQGGVDANRATLWNGLCGAAFTLSIKAPPLVLLTISEASSNAIQLEWTGGPANATKWQYRTRTWSAGTASAWGGWTDMTGSAAGTRSYRVTGLTAGTAYEFRVRAVAGTQVLAEYTETEFALTRRGLGYTKPANDLPIIDPGLVIEGDGSTQWRIAASSVVVVIPDGMRLRAGHWSSSYLGAYDLASGLHDLESGSVLWIGFDEDTDKLTIFAREVRSGAGDDDESAQRDDDAPTRDVGALFDQIEASLTEVPRE